MTGAPGYADNRFKKGDVVTVIRMSVVAASLCCLIAATAILVLRSEDSSSETTPTSVDVVSVRTRDLVEKVRGRLGVTGDRVVDCLARELDERPDLVVDLDEQGERSRRVGELDAMAGACSARSAGAQAVLGRLRSRPGVQFDDVKERCVLSSLERYSPDDLARLSDPGGGPGSLDDRVNELLVVCGAAPLT